VSETKAVNPFAMLEGHKNVNLTTFRKSGEPAVTPVWYVVFDGKLYVRTGASSGKVERIRNDPRVQLAPSTVRGKQAGPTSEGRDRILGSGEKELAQKALKLLRHRYMSAPIVDLFIRGEESAVLEIASVRT
jgi:PPOX class probable F420-dependent enzyme